MESFQYSTYPKEIDVFGFVNRFIVFECCPPIFIERKCSGVLKTEKRKEKKKERSTWSNVEFPFWKPFACEKNLKKSVLGLFLRQVGADYGPVPSIPDDKIRLFNLNFCAETFGCGNDARVLNLHKTFDLSKNRNF